MRINEEKRTDYGITLAAGRAMLRLGEVKLLEPNAPEHILIARLRMQSCPNRIDLQIDKAELGAPKATLKLIQSSFISTQRHVRPCRGARIDSQILIICQFHNPVRCGQRIHHGVKSPVSV